jgi:type II secretory pathway pseudopilin PulG
MASGTQKKKGTPKKVSKATRSSSVVSKKGTPWGTIIAVIGVVALLGAVLGYYLVQSEPKREQKTREEAAAAYAPTAQNPDPSTKIEGVTTAQYTGSVHVLATERVAYDKTPPFGGPHDGSWAACTGIVYPNAVRTENMVHSLEHGAIWIAYNPAQVTGPDLNLLKVRVDGKPYSMMSPYPGLDKPISLQSWGHQLKLDKADDPRIDQFITALRSNPNGVYPEVGASCDAMGPGAFDPDNPPPFDPTPPGPDAKAMDYKGSEGAQPDAAGNTGAPVVPGQ